MILIGCVLALLALVEQSAAYSCPTCYKSACLSDNVPRLKCTRTATVLPLSEITINLTENTEYGCLELEYIEDGKQQHLKQCVTSNEEDDLCEIFKKNLNVTFCNLVKQSGNLVIKDYNIATDAPSTTTSPTDTPTTTTNPTDTPSTTTSPTDTPSTITTSTDAPSTTTSPTDATSTTTNSTNPSNPTSEQPETTTAASNKIPIQSFVTVTAFVTALTVILS